MGDGDGGVLESRRPTIDDERGIGSAITFDDLELQLRSECHYAREALGTAVRIHGLKEAIRQVRRAGTMPEGTPLEELLLRDDLLRDRARRILSVLADADREAPGRVDELDEFVQRELNVEV